MDFDTDFWSEIEDSTAEIFDIEDLYEEDDNEEQSFNQYLNSNYDY